MKKKAAFLVGVVLLISADQVGAEGRRFPQGGTVSNNHAEMHTTFTVFEGALTAQIPAKHKPEGTQRRAKRSDKDIEASWDLTAFGSFTCHTDPWVQVGEHWEMPVTIFSGGYPQICTPWGQLTMQLYTPGDSHGAIVSAGGTPEFPATSYMDVWFLITVNGVSLIHGQPVRVEVTEPTIRAWPPQGAEYVLTNGPMPLYRLGDEAKTPVAKLDGTTISIRWPVSDPAPIVTISSSELSRSAGGKDVRLGFDVSKTLPTAGRLGYSVVDEHGWIERDGTFELRGEIPRGRQGKPFRIPVRVVSPDTPKSRTDVVTLQIFPLRGTNAFVTRHSVEVRVE